MWEKGSFEIDGSKFVYWHYFESCIVRYDRGWDIEPKDDLARKALEYVLNLYK